MRYLLLGWASALAFLALSPTNRAVGQTGGGGVGTDPFSFYYGYYLPHQAYIAAQPRPLDTINQVVATRQYSAQTDRTALYDPISPYGDEELDPLRPYAAKKERLARPQTFVYGNATGSNTAGQGPPLYFNRSARYFPTLRVGRGPNRNVAVVRGPRGGGGGYGSVGVPGAGPSLPSPSPIGR
jgi:hypothetical protein